MLADAGAGLALQGKPFPHSEPLSCRTARSDWPFRAHCHSASVGSATAQGRVSRLLLAVHDLADSSETECRFIGYGSSGGYVRRKRSVGALTVCRCRGPPRRQRAASGRAGRQGDQEENTNLITEIGVRLGGVRSICGRWIFGEELLLAISVRWRGPPAPRPVNQVPDDLVSAFADAGLLRRVFQNLIANAITAHPGQRGEVIISRRAGARRRRCRRVLGEDIDPAVREFRRSVTEKVFVFGWKPDSCRRRMD